MTLKRNHTHSPKQRGPKCIICVAENCRHNYELSKTATSLTMFRLAVNKVAEAVSFGYNAINDAGCKHSNLTDPQIFNTLLLLDAQSQAKQVVDAEMLRRP